MVRQWKPQHFEIQVERLGTRVFALSLHSKNAYVNHVEFRSRISASAEQSENFTFKGLMKSEELMMPAGFIWLPLLQ